MGLYGGIKADAAVGEAYNSSPDVDANYGKEIVLFYSEIDSALHAAVSGGTYGNEDYPSAFDYKPEFFLINGDTYPSTSPVTPDGSDLSLNTNDKILIRFINAGLKSHIPVLTEGHLNIIAEDGNLYPYAKERYSFLLAAGKTLDALWEPNRPGTYPVIDRCNHLTDDGSPGGGMLTHLVVEDIGGAPVATDNNYSIVEDGNLIVPPAGVLADDTGTSLSAILVSDVGNGLLALNADGSFDFEPNLNFSGTDIFTYKANDGANDSNEATVKIEVTPVNDAPVAVNDISSTVEGVSVIIDVLANDTDADGDPLVVTNLIHDGINASVTVNPDNTLTYSPNSGYTGPDSLTYTANDAVLDSNNIATVTLTVDVRVNSEPIAEDDFATTTKNTPVFIDLVSNDHDSDGTIDPNSIQIATSPTRGGTVTVLTGGVTFTPKKNFRGTDVFTYTVDDNEAATSDTATVRVNVVR
jgi:FtsP/CotA-like multicopper oxidase with cupredoxin domain